MVGAAVLIPMRSRDPTCPFSKACSMDSLMRRGDSDENDELLGNSPGRSHGGRRSGDGNLESLVVRNAPLEEDKRNCNGENYERLEQNTLPN